MEALDLRQVLGSQAEGGEVLERFMKKPSAGRDPPCYLVMSGVLVYERRPFESLKLFERKKNTNSLFYSTSCSFHPIAPIISCIVRSD